MPGVNCLADTPDTADRYQSQHQHSDTDAENSVDIHGISPSPVGDVGFELNVQTYDYKYSILRYFCQVLYTQDANKLPYFKQNKLLKK